jgi:hypothetical protein
MSTEKVMLKAGAFSCLFLFRVDVAVPIAAFTIFAFLVQSNAVAVRALFESRHLLPSITVAQSHSSLQVQVLKIDGVTTLPELTLEDGANMHWRSIVMLAVIDKTVAFVEKKVLPIDLNAQFSVVIDDPFDIIRFEVAHFFTLF